MASLRGRKYSKLEKQAEKRACKETDETSYIEILRASGKPTEWPSWETKKGARVDVMVRAQDIFNVKTWLKFLIWQGKNNADLTSLTEDAKGLAEAYDNFLEERHTERYRNLDAEGKIWRHMVVEKAVKWHILNNKLTAWENGDDDAFEDENVGLFLKLTKAIKVLRDECARVMQHIKADPQLAKSETAKFFELFNQTFQSIKLEQRNELMRLIGIDDQENEGDVA